MQDTCSVGADVGIDPYDQVDRCLRICRKIPVNGCILCGQTELSAPANRLAGDALTWERPSIQNGRTPYTGVLPFWSLAVLRILILRLVRGVLRFGLVRFVLFAHDEPPE